MPPKTKAATAKTLIGQPDSVLTDEFFQAVQVDEAYGELLPFSGALQLPTVEQVVKLFFFLKEQVGPKNSHVSQNQISKKVVAYVVKYWKMAGFETVTEQSMMRKLNQEVEKYQMINKNKNRDSEKEVNKRKEYLDNVKKLFDVAASNLEESLVKDRLLTQDDENPLYRVNEGYTRKTEDIAFLEDQRGERKMVMGERDATFEARKIARNQKNLEKFGKVIVEVNNNENSSKTEADDSTDDEANDDIEFKIKDKVRKKDEPVIVEFPKDILNSPEVCAMLDRTATTSRNAVGIVSSILKAGKIDGQAADLSKFSLSRTTLERKRVSNRSVLMEQARQEFQESKPRHPALHWDGALVKDVTGTLQENESILVSGAPHYLEGKLLCVSKLVDEEGKPTSTGEAQASAVLEEIKAWGVEKDIVAFVFDTTASNTGRVRGATVRLQKELGRHIFFLGCRHHISELIVKAVWYCMFEQDLSPDNKFFSNIREVWDDLDTSPEAKFFVLDKNTFGREEALQFFQQILLKKNRRNDMMIRDDYRELAECSVMLLGDLPPSGKIFWRKPGACHKARFCAFGIYGLKALAFSSQLDLDDETIELLIRFCTFLTIIYIPHFLTSSIGCDAPVNDLRLFEQLFRFRTVDSQLADEALVLLRRHCWYLTPEVVVFSLFSGKVSNDEKSRLASRLLTLDSRIPKSEKLEKPKFPDITEKTKLVDLISSQSYRFFRILGLDFPWLAMDPVKWEEEETYVMAKEFVTTVKVTNDIAERGVKLAKDYATLLTKDDSIRDELLQGVERCRRKFPDFAKKTLNS